MRVRKTGAGDGPAERRPVSGWPLPGNHGPFPKPDKDSILVCPVGGAGRIGMNWTLYGHDGRWLLVDAGSTFAPRDVEGVEAIFPDVGSIRSILPHLDGLVVTHAHEDHIGAIHRLWPGISCPIYATPFASALIRNRLAEAGTIGRVKMRSFTPNQTFTVGPFSIRSVRMTHSVPECVALALRTPSGTVFHTGDWKFDDNPVVGHLPDYRALRQVGVEGVLAMVCDSTNANRDAGSLRTNEAQVQQGFVKAFRRVPGMVVVACFSSNVARVASASIAAAETGRRLAIAGRSLVNSEKAARECGLLNGVPMVLGDVRQTRNLRPRQVAVICTGAQGEGNAALAKMAAGDGGRFPKLGRGDAVIHSARIIPGNEEEVHAMFDRLRERGVQVLRDEFEGSPLHVSGHATAGEIADLYGMVRPRFAIPVHGEEQHLNAHLAIAARAGVRDAAFTTEGDVWRVNAEGVTKVASVSIGLNCELASMRGRHVPWNPADPLASLAFADGEDLGVPKAA